MEMKYITFIVLFVIIKLSFSLGQSCLDYQCDSIELRKFFIAAGADTSADVSSYFVEKKRLEWFSGFFNVDSLPSQIGKLTALKHLSLNNGKLKFLPPEIGNLTNLEYLDLSDNQLEELPNEIGRLTKLKHLDVRNNNLHNLPDSIVNLQSLDPYIDLSNAYFCYIRKNYLCSFTDAVAKWVDKYAHQQVCVQKEICSACTTTSVKKQHGMGINPLRVDRRQSVVYDLRGNRVRGASLNAAAASQLPVGCYIADFGAGTLRRVVVR